MLQFTPALPARSRRLLGINCAPLLAFLAKKWGHFQQGTLGGSVHRFFTRFWPTQATTKPGVAISPNPCQSSQVLTLHLHNLRSCPLQVKVLSQQGELLVEREVFPLSNHHRQPLTLPRNTPAGMYHCVVQGPGGLTHKAWLAMME